MTGAGITDNRPDRGADRGRLPAVRDHIEHNLASGSLTPLNTARALGISVRQLHLLFKPTGTTFARYVLARRLEQARLQLVAQPGRNVLEIALACGIESSTVFYRAFRSAFGMTPTEYRRSAQEGAQPDSSVHSADPEHRGTT